MALLLHRAARADVLADGLATLLQTPLPDPFATEVVVVPARGMERWLSQRISHRLGARPGEHDGICAGVEFRTPRSLVAELAGTRDSDPWSPDTLAWPLLRVLDEQLAEPWAAVLAAHVGHGRADEEGDLRRGRRFAVARRLASLFASYAVQRPRLLTDWSAGTDTDGAGEALDPDLRWQPELWRRLVPAVGAPPPGRRHEQVLAALAEDPAAADLPQRLSLFGHTRLPVTEVELLAALATHRDVHLWLPHPSAELWAALAQGTDASRATPTGTRAGPIRRREDTSYASARHPLLASLGRDVRELQRLLGDTVGVDRALPSDEPADDLLSWLQADLRDNRVPDPVADGRTVSAGRAGPGRRLLPADRSVQVHACHGLARQVEVLREVLLGLLADDATLEPRDILVMCPDVESVAPLVSAAFGLGDVVGRGGHPAHRLRVKLADRSLTQTNPLLAVAGRLLDLAGGRAGASEVLDLAHLGPVRRRFRFTDDDLQQLATWVREAGVRWAFDAEHRAGYGLDSYVQNTWQFGLDRLLAGVTMSGDADAWLDRTLPLDDVGSGQVELAGRLAELVARLTEVTDRLTGSRPLDAWVGTLSDGIAAVTDVAPTEAWQQAQVTRELAEVREEAAHLAGTSLLLPDVRSLLQGRLAGRPSRANFRTGTLTVCTMVPMRSVPHRVVCLLGLDDGVFPRSAVQDGDDVLARTPLTGERDPRSEDRQLLLDAIMAATETLVVTYSGANEYSGQKRPPAVPLQELLDALDLTATTGAARSVSRTVTVRHPLQPHDPRNLRRGELVPGRSFSFDPAAGRGAAAALGPRSEAPPFLPGRLPPMPGGDVALADLAAFLRHPVRFFLRERLDVALPADDDPVDDSLPVEIDNLARWAVGDRLLRDMLAGVPPDRAGQREWRRGVLPPGHLGWRLLDELLKQAVPLARAALDLRGGAPPEAVDVDLPLGAGRRLTGTVPGTYAARLVPVSFSRLGPTHRLQAWLHLLALSAGEPDRSWQAHTVGRPSRGRAPGTDVSILGPVPEHVALEQLRSLVDLADRARREPLPLPLKSSHRYAQLRRTRANTEEALRGATLEEWQDATYPREQSDAAHVRVWGARADLPGQVPALPDETFEGETARFGALSLRLWSPLLSSEQGSW